jgi:hypothetical protein
MGATSVLNMFDRFADGSSIWLGGSHPSALKSVNENFKVMLGKAVNRGGKVDFRSLDHYESR